MKRYVIFIILAAFICCTGFRWGGGGGGGVPLWKIGETVGVWSGAESYDKGEVVGHEGNGYISAQDNNLNHEPGESGSETWWGLVAAKGDTGATGARGATWYTGFDTPAGAGVTGADNDLFFDTSVESKVFKKVSGTWTQLGSIKGATGAAGQDGQDGTNGADGQDGAGIEAGADGEHFLRVVNSLTFSGTPAEGDCQYSTFLTPAGWYCYDGADWVLQGGGASAIADLTDWPSGLSATELGYVNGVTSGIQAQIDALTVGAVPFVSDTTPPATASAINYSTSDHKLRARYPNGDVYASSALTLETAADTTPSAFSFTDLTDVELSTEQTSAPITVAAINWPAAISVTGGTYEINASGSFTASSGTVAVGDTVRARHTSSGSNSTAVNTVVTIGGVSDTFTSTTVAGITYLVNQNFEGTGYDNSETWTEGGSGTKDEDYATSPAPLCGSQSLAIDSTSATGYAYKTITSSDEVWSHFLFSVPASAPGSNNVIANINTGSTQRAALLYRSDGAWGMQHGSVFWNSGAAKPTANTTYHVWWHYKPETVPGTSNDGVNELWWGTTVNRSEATSVTQQTNGNGDGSIDRFYASNGITGTGVYIFDQILVAGSEFTVVSSCD